MGGMFSVKSVLRRFSSATSATPVITLGTVTRQIKFLFCKKTFYYYCIRENELLSSNGSSNCDGDARAASSCSRSNDRCRSARSLLRRSAGVTPTSLGPNESAQNAYYVSFVTTTTNITFQISMSSVHHVLFDVFHGTRRLGRRRTPLIERLVGQFVGKQSQMFFRLRRG